MNYSLIHLVIALNSINLFFNVLTILTLCFIFLENRMYLFDGKDYSKEPSKEDRKSFELLVNLWKILLKKKKKVKRAGYSKIKAV